MALSHLLAGSYGKCGLIPLGAEIDRERDVDIEAVNADSVLGIMAFARNRLNFVILDACRNNPYQRSFRSVTRGLARMDAPRGSLVAYATSPGNVAMDGNGNNSPYTEALAEAMRTPGLSAEHVFRQTRLSVIERTRDRQVPWEASSLTGDFFFKAGSKVAAPAGDVEQSTEYLFWQSIQASANAESYKAYLEAYPEGTYAVLAVANLRHIEQEEARQRRNEIERAKIEQERLRLDQERLRIQEEAGARERNRLDEEKKRREAEQSRLAELAQEGLRLEKERLRLQRDRAAPSASQTATVTAPSASVRDKPQPADIGPVARFDGEWKWRMKLSSVSVCEGIITHPLDIKDGKLEGGFTFIGAVGHHYVEGKIEKTGKAKFFGTAQFSIIEYWGKFSGTKGSGTLKAENELGSCEGTWDATRVAAH